MRYRSKIFYTWDSDLAYLAGLIASDGCLSNDGRHITLVSKDLEIIHYTQLILGKTNKIGTKFGQFKTNAYYFQFSDVALYDFLYEAGITPAKSKTIQRISVPDKFYSNFLRGYFDGDGTTYGYRDVRWKNSYMYYTEFISASKEFLLWLKFQNENLIRTELGKIQLGKRAHRLVYAKADSRTLFKAMYGGTATYKLTRKHTKLQHFITSDPHVKIPLNARVLE